MHRAYKNEKDVRYILDNLRKEDLNEAEAIYGADFKEQILNNIMKTEFYVLLGKTKDKDIPVCMGGIWPPSENTPDIGICWLMCTDKVKKHIKCLLKELKTEIKKADENFCFTYNLIWKENKSAKKWLKGLGYKFDNPKPDGINIPDGFEFFYRLRPVKGLGE